MGVVSLPDTLCTQIEVLMNTYWWSSKKEGKGMPWMQWRRMALPKMDGGLGVRTLEEFNVAMLAKQGWRLLTETSSLAARILKCKYFPRTDFLGAELHEGSRPSFTWRSIMSAQYLLRDGCRKRIGSGSSVAIWGDKWLPDFPYVVTTPEEEDCPLRWVNEIIDMDSHTWNLEVIETFFHPEDVRRITSIPLSQSAMEDGWIWLFDVKGQYTVKSGHHRAMTIWRLERGLNVVLGNSPWRCIWNSEVPEKVKIWHWRACHGALAVCARLRSRGMDVNHICPVCRGDDESIMHLVRDCVVAKEVLQRSRLSNKFANFQGESYSDLLMFIESQWTKDEREEWFALGWLLWDARNKFYWQKKDPSPTTIIYTASRLLREWKTSALDRTSPPTRHPSALQWTPPPDGILKINVDGAIFIHAGRGAAGMVVRGHDGGVISMQSCPIPGLVDPAIVEARAMAMAMEWAIQKEWRRVIFETDCAVLATSLQKGVVNYVTEVGIVMMDCKRMLEQFDSVTIQHIRRQGNMVADGLARHGLSLTEKEEWWHDFPPSFMTLAANDSTME